MYAKLDYRPLYLRSAILAYEINKLSDRFGRNITSATKDVVVKIKLELWDLYTDIPESVHTSDPDRLRDKIYHAIVRISDIQRDCDEAPKGAKATLTIRRECQQRCWDAERTLIGILADIGETFAA